MRRIVLTIGVAVPLLVGVMPHVTPGAEAVVVCERKGKVRLREKCKAKETPVMDVEALEREVGARRDRVAAREALLSAVRRQLDLGAASVGIDCSGDPGRQELPRSSILSGLEPCTFSGCRALDGDAAACASSYERVGAIVSGCVMSGGRCLLGVCAELGGLGREPCEPDPVTCDGAPGRTFVGDAFLCTLRTTELGCNGAWGTSGGSATSCFWDATSSRCGACGEHEESMGSCVDSCRTSTPECADGSRTLGPCSDASNEPTCDGRWQIDDGAGVSCWWDPVANQCDRCDLREEIRGSCENVCD